MSNDSWDWKWVDVDPLQKHLLVEKAFREVAVPQAQLETEVKALACAAAPAPVAETRPALNRSAGAHVDLAKSLEKQGEWQPAADAFRWALDAEPACDEAGLGLGACLLHLERAQEALDCFELCLKSGFRPERSLLGKAVALQKLGRLAAADRVYHELLEGAPEHPEALANLIALSVERKDPEAVAEYSLRLVKVDPESKAALRGLAAYAAWNRNPEEMETTAVGNGVVQAAYEQFLKRGISKSITSMRLHLSSLLNKRLGPALARTSWSGFYHRTPKESEERAS